jgi:hypothetical protein
MKTVPIFLNIFTSLLVNITTADKPEFVIECLIFDRKYSIT